MSTILVAGVLASCRSEVRAESTASATVDTADADRFCADSAYAWVKSQTDLGPRVPGTKAHAECAAMLADGLKGYGADTVILQRATLSAYNGDRLPIVNILGRFNTDAAKRVLLVSHWDSRPWADAATDEDVRRKPIDGANDGASGVGVLMEIARQVGLEHPEIGVDILFADAEDYGVHDDDETRVDRATRENSWCLGSQYFADNLPYSVSDMPAYGILLDMVGGQGARFNREYFSTQYAPNIVARVWSEAARIGLGDRFPQEVWGAVTDDHLPLCRAGIPTIDIIENRNPLTDTFAPTWHTPDDNIGNIDRTSLDAVGRVVTSVIYREKAN